MYWISNHHRCKVYVLEWFAKLFFIEWVRTRVTFREIDVEAEIGKKVSDQNFQGSSTVCNKLGPKLALRNSWRKFNFVNQLQALIAMGLRVNHDSAAATWNTLKKCEIYQNLNEVSLQIYGGNFCFMSEEF